MIYGFIVPLYIGLFIKTCPMKLKKKMQEKMKMILQKDENFVHKQ